MSLDWCPGIREVCLHWSDAPMLQQTFEELERPLRVEASRLLYQLDREAYIEALNAARSVPVSTEEIIEEQGKI